MSLGGYRGRRIHGKLLPASAQQIRAIMWMYHKSQGIALIVQGPQVRGQSRQCRGLSDTFFHEAWSPRDPPRDIGFVPTKIGIQDNLCTEKAKTSFLLVLGCTPDWILPYESFFLKASLGLNFSKVFHTPSVGLWVRFDMDLGLRLDSWSSKMTTFRYCISHSFAPWKYSHRYDT